MKMFIITFYQIQFLELVLKLKLKSIEYDNRDITGYIVPYHAHSDFIQLGAELGIIGFSLLGNIFNNSFFRLKIIWKSKISEKDKVFHFYINYFFGCLFY